nr:transcription factor IIS [Tanacetum cinerariifolium]
TSTDSEIGKDDDNVNGNDSHDDNVNGNVSHLFKSSVNSKTSYMGLDTRTMDPLEVARQVAIEVERDVDYRERSCSTTSDKTTDSKIDQKSQCKPDGQKS